ncbi:PAS domain S-box protein [Verrucomicrobiota bacterium sgz303538]
MIPPPIPANEAERLAALHALGVLDTLREERFDRITRLAARLCRVPYVAVSLIDKHRQWFKSAVGIEETETTRDISFCGHAITEDAPLVVPDAAQDQRFAQNPKVTAPNGIRFYAGRKLQTRDGHCVGTLCVADHVPREFSADDLANLNDLADLAQAELNAVGLNDALFLLTEANRQRTEQKQMFDAFMGNSPCVVYIKDEEGRYVYVNRRFEDQFGMQLAESLGKRDGEWLPQEVARQIEENDRRILHSGRPEQLQEVAPTPDGKMRHWLSLKFPLKTGAGKLLLAGTSIDITAEKENEAALRASEERYRDLFDNAGDMIGCVDAEGRYLYVNPAWHDVHGYTPEELPQLRILDIVAPEDRERAAHAFRRALGGEDLLGVQVHILTKDGRKLLIEGNVSHSIEDGKPVARGMFRDITSRRKAEDALNRLMTLQRAILDGANCSIISTDQNGLILTFNSTAERWFGYSANEMVGKENCCLLHDHTEIAARADEISTELGRRVTPGFEAFAAAAREIQADEREWTYVRRDGTRFPVSLSLTALRDANGVIFGFLSVARDITHEKEAHEAMLQAKSAAEQANQTKSRFLANMSHEIRTPLNGILGINAMLLETPLNSEQRRLAETVRESSESLLEIVNDVLDFSKVESGLFELEHRDFSLQGLLSELHRLHGARASAKGLLLEIKSAPEVPARIVGDSVRVRQILSNLISNAIKFSENGKIAISITRIPSREKEDVRLRFGVTDKGIGIAPEAQERVFEAFQQADSSMSRKYGGTGLGLSISKQLVLLMKGEIGVESMPGEGSTFWFTAPFTIAAELTDPKSPEATAATAPASLSLVLNVLVAEDSSVNQLVIKHELRKLGCEVHSTSNGREAVDAFFKTPFDLVLMDCQMPEMDGYEAATRIRQHAGAGQHVPIIAITANALAGERERCLKAGMTDYVSKPFTREKLRAAILAAASHADEAPPAESPAIDETEMEALRAEGEDAGIDLIAQLGEAFRFEAAHAIQAFDEAVASSDAALIARTAHKLKGSAGNFGAKPLQILCLELEKLSREQKLQSASARIPDLRREVNRVIAALRMKHA